MCRGKEDVTDRLAEKVSSRQVGAEEPLKSQAEDGFSTERDRLGSGRQETPSGSCGRYTRGWEARVEAGGLFKQEAMKPETDRIVGVDISEQGKVREADHQQNHLRHRLSHQRPRRS